ncbi:hypothetical protein AXA74_20275 [Bordetella hinzii LMG 13501]|nr:hypothetical protein AXA74_20275 [Bordetella hinzii LMG 13501]
MAAGNLIALVAALVGSDRAWRVAVSNDQTLNAALAGSEDETISSRAGKAARAGRKWGCVLCKVLDRFDPQHCQKNIEEDEGEGTRPT